MKTPVDPENSLPHIFTPMVTLSVWTSLIPDGVERMSGVSSPVYPLSVMVTNYLAPLILRGSLTRWTADCQCSFVGSIENLASDGMSYSLSPAVHDLSPGSPL